MNESFTNPHPESWETRTAAFKLRSDGIVEYTLKEGVTQTITDYQETVLTMIRHLGGYRKYPMLSVICEGATVEPDAMRYARKVEYLIPINALAILVPGRLAYVMARAYYVVYKPQVPFRVFLDRSEAENWLRQFVSEEALA